MAQCLDRLQLKSDVPCELLCLTSIPDCRWSHCHTSHTLASCTDVLCWHIAQSRTILGTTFNDHAKHWQDQVVKRYLQMSRDRARQRHKNLVNIIDTSVDTTSGVPQDWHTNQEMYEEVKVQEKSQESDAKAEEVSVVVRHHIHPVLTQSRRQVSTPTSGGGEYISLGNISSQESEPSGMSEKRLPFYC
jgi:hypothetical protein